MASESIFNFFRPKQKARAAGYADTEFAETIEVDFKDTAPGVLHGNDDEGLESWHYQGKHVANDGKLLTRHLRIRFIDKAGRVTERDIDTKRVLTDGHDGLIFANCHLRGADRSFAMSRIDKLLDLDTGESPENIAAWFLSQQTQEPHA